MSAQEAISFQQVLAHVTRPARYTNGEWNAVAKDWTAAKARLALVYPDAYEAGATNLGLATLYELFNQQTDVLAERAFTPWLDMEQVIRHAGLPLYSLESRRPLSDFDVIYIALGHELTYSSVLTILDLPGLSLSAVERHGPLPLIIAGDRCASNPEPLADFIDSFIIGDTEEPLAAVAELVARFKVEGGTKRDLLHGLASLSGVYIPSLYTIKYDELGDVTDVSAANGVLQRPRQYLSSRLPYGPIRPPVPYLQALQDRATLEVQRGVTYGCRCCQVGLQTRPMLLRDPTEVISLARELIANTGYKELSLATPSPTDGVLLLPILEAIRAGLGDSVTLLTDPLATQGFNDAVAQALVSRNRNSVTFMLEAGSERLRQVVGRPASDEEIVAAVEVAFHYGLTNVRLQFKVGLPKETDEDLLAIARLTGAMQERGRQYSSNLARVQVNVAPFVPRPHTPFQWAPQAPIETLFAKYDLLRRACKRAGVGFSAEKPQRGLLEAALSRGDRRLGAAIARAWDLGIRFDGWREHFQWPRWEQAFAEVGLAPSYYANRQIPIDEMLPWSHIDMGLEESLLRDEWEKATKPEEVR